MIRGVYHSTSGMNYLQYKQEVTANNIANANTTGFKKDNAFWRTLSSLSKISNMNATEQRNLDEVDEYYTDFSQGSFNVTNNPLDFAIEGPGFFNVQTPHGQRYTRNGHWTVNQDKLLVTNNGYPILGERGPIRITGDKIWIEDNGNVNVDGAVVDRLVMTEFKNPKQLKKLGDGLFEFAGPSQPPSGAPATRIRQGVLEESNVNAIQEMVTMISTTQNFESGQKSIIMQDQTLDRAVNDVGRIAR